MHLIQVLYAIHPLHAYQNNSGVISKLNQLQIISKKLSTDTSTLKITLKSLKIALQFSKLFHNM